jgi:hypothetical protein
MCTKLAADYVVGDTTVPAVVLPANHVANYMKNLTSIYTSEPYVRNGDAFSMK